MKKLRAIIAEDEPLAMRRLRDMLLRLKIVDIVGECTDGNQASAAIGELHPDLVFLDVQMPEATGLDVLQRIERRELPLVIFVSAYDEFAIQAYESHAIDYLLKPVEPERLRDAVSRAARILEGVESRALLSRLGTLAGAAGTQYLTRVGVRRGNRILLLRINQVSWMESDGNYARLYAGKESYLLRTTMYALEQELDPKDFVRIHRARIVNLNHVAELSVAGDGDPFVTLTDGTRLEMQRAYLSHVRAAVRNG